MGTPLDFDLTDPTALAASAAGALILVNTVTTSDSSPLLRGGAAVAGLVMGNVAYSVTFGPGGLVGSVTDPLGSLEATLEGKGSSFQLLTAGATTYGGYQVGKKVASNWFTEAETAVEDAGEDALEDAPEILEMAAL